MPQCVGWPSAGANATLDYESLFLRNLALIERVIASTGQRHRLSASEREEFASVARLRLIEEDYAVLRRFQGRSALQTYLAVVIQRMFLDWRISRWGKWRPSAHATRSGPVAVLLEKLMERDGLTFDEAYEVIRTNHRIEASRDALYALTRRMRRQPRFVDDRGIELTSAEPSATEPGRSDADRAASIERIEHALSAARSRLDPRDQLIVRMRFDSGFTVQQIAAALAIDPKPLYRRIERVLGELRKSLEAAGISDEDIAELLSERAYPRLVHFEDEEPGN